MQTNLPGDVVLEYAVLGNADTNRPAPIALTPPTVTAPSRPAIIQPTIGPAARIGTSPGTRNNPDLNSSPQDTPTLPQYIMRSPEV
jgi:hypothetical protein